MRPMVQLYSVVKQQIQAKIHSGLYKLVWSYILDYENSRNPFAERRKQIARWRLYSEIYIIESEKVEALGVCPRMSFFPSSALFF